MFSEVLKPQTQENSSDILFAEFLRKFDPFENQLPDGFYQGHLKYNYVIFFFFSDALMGLELTTVFLVEQN